MPLDKRQLERDVIALMRECEDRANTWTVRDKPKDLSEARSNGQHLAYTHIAKRLRALLRYDAQDQKQQNG